jgi:peptidoglycan hydrolase-like protein with peptidoglycan-binding domain
VSSTSISSDGVSDTQNSGVQSVSHALLQDAARQILDAFHAGLTQGKSGEAVMVLQYALHVLGLFPEYPADAVFGVSTAEALNTFQQQNGLQATGAADTATIGVLLKQALATNMATPKKPKERKKKKEKEKAPEVMMTPPSYPVRDSPFSSVNLFSPGSQSFPSSSSDSFQTPPQTPSKSKVPFTSPSSFEQLHLRVPSHKTMPLYTPMWVYSTEVQEITTLVIITKGLVCHRACMRHVTYLPMVFRREKKKRKRNWTDVKYNFVIGCIRAMVNT